MRFRSFGILFVVCLSPLSLAQQKKPSARVEAVFAAIENRMYRQSDYWWDDGDFNRCVNLLRFMFRMFPGEYEIATDLGWMLENIERYDEALKTYQDFRSLNPGDAEAAFPEANYYFAKKQYDKVWPILAPTLAKKPHPNSFRICAHSYERTGRLKESKAVWELLLKQVPDDGPAKVNLKRVTDKIAKGG